MNNKLKRVIGLMIALLLIGGIWYGINKNKSEEGVIKLGAVFSLTSFGASWGEYDRDAALLAVKEIDQSGGINGRKIDLTIEDDQSTSKGAVQAANKLISIDKVNFILTGWADYTNSIAPLLADKKVIGITVSAGSPDITKQSSWLFRVWPNDGFLSQALVNYIDQKNYKKIAIFRTSGSWEDGTALMFKQQIKDFGRFLVDEEVVNPGSKDFKTNISKILETRPDVIYVLALAPNTGVFARQMADFGSSIPMLFATDLNNPDIISGAGGSKTLEGMVYPVYERPTQDFINKFTDEYGHAPGISGDTAYDAVNLIATTLKRIDSNDPEEIRLALSETENYQGVSGMISFDENRDRKAAPVVLMTVKNGEFVELK